MGEYTFLAYGPCFEQVTKFAGDNPGSGTDSLRTQIRKIKIDPFKAGGSLHFSHPTLHGRIFKVYVRGDTISRQAGYRLIYLVSQAKRLAIGIYFSSVPRKDFNYRNVAWLQMAEEIEQALKRNDLSVFRAINVGG